MYMGVALTLSRALDELIDGSNTVVRKVTMVSHSVQARAWTSLIGGPRCYICILASGVNVL